MRDSEHFSLLQGLAGRPCGRARKLWGDRLTNVSEIWRHYGAPPTDSEQFRTSPRTEGAFECTVYPPNSPTLVDSGPKGEVMRCAPISQQVAVPVMGFTTFMGQSSGTGAASRPGDRQSDLLDSFGAVFVLMAVAFGPALTWLLVG